MERFIKVPRKRRSRNVISQPSREVEEDRKRAKVMSEGVEEPCVITKGEYHKSLKAKWNRLSQKVIAHLGAKEMAALCQELEVVGSSEDLSSVIHSDGTNTTATTAAEISSLQLQVEELRSRNKELEKSLEALSENAYVDAQSARATEMELESAEQKSMALKEALEKKIADLDEENAKQSLMIEFYGTRMEDLKTRIGELEDCLAATSSKARRTENCGKEIEDENSLEALRVQNKKLKEELTRVRSQLEVAGFQVELEIEKKDEAIAELMALQTQKALYDEAELVELQNLRQMFEAGKDELAELRSQKRFCEAERYELTGLRCQKERFEAERNELVKLRGQKKVHEAERSELAELRGLKRIYEFEGTELADLRSQKRMYEEAEDELTALRSLKKTFQAAENELLELRKQKAVHEAAAENERLPVQKKLFEAVTEELKTIRRQKATFEAATEELERLRDQKAIYEAFSEELAALRKQREIAADEHGESPKRKKMSEAEREELDALRRQRATYEAAEKEFAMRRVREIAMTTKEQSLVAKVQRLIQKQAKLVSTIKYLEMKRTEDKQEHDRNCLELEAVRSKIHQSSADSKAAEEHLVSVCKEKASLQEQNFRLQGEKDRMFKENHNLQRRLHHANSEITNLLTEIERVEKAKTRVEIDSIALNKELAGKEAKIESLREELRLKQDICEATAANAEKQLEEVEILRGVNCAYMDQERKLRRELSCVTKRLDDATTEELCRVCLINTRDTVILPCTHMQSCVRCVKELIQNDKSCPTCDKAIAGYVPCNAYV